MPSKAVRIRFPAKWIRLGMTFIFQRRRIRRKKCLLYSTADLIYTTLHHSVPGMRQKSFLQALTMFLCFSRPVPAPPRPTNPESCFVHAVETCGLLLNRLRMTTDDEFLGALC